VYGPLCYVATQYTAASTSIESCSREDNVRPGEFASYTALCGDDGYADVTIHVYDASFSVTDVATIPDLCSPVVSSGRTVSHTFQLLCVPDSDPCFDREKQECLDVTDGVLVEEDYENGQALDWIFGSEDSSDSFSKFLGRLGGSRPEVARAFTVPTDADLISLEFNFYEIDNWQPEDKLFVRVGNSYMDLGNFEGASSGYFGDIAFSIESSPSAPGNLGFNGVYQDQMHKINLVIPKSWYPLGRLTIGFKVATTQCLECASAGIDNFKIAVICEAPTGNPTLGTQADSLTSSPTFNPTSSPTDKPSIEPTEIVRAPSVDSASDNVCIYESATLISYIGSQNYSSLPFEIISTQADTVTFSVSQVWVDGTVCAVATEYPTSETDSTCQREINQRTGEIGTYTAFCNADGIANIKVYVHDATFAVNDDARWPAYCSPVEDPPIHQIMYEFELSCVPIDQNCVPQAEAIDCGDGFDKVILDENFEDPSDGQSENWHHNWEGAATEHSSGLTSFLGRLGKDKVEIARTLVVPPSAESLLIEFDFLEIDQWESSDKVYFRMQGFYLSFGSFSMTRNEAAISGYYFSSRPEEERVAVAVWRQTNQAQLGFSSSYTDQKHRVKMVIPKFYFPSGRLVVGFSTRMSYPIDNESAGFDNIKATIICGNADCKDGNDIAVSYEDFENPGETDTWTGGLESFAFDSTILGRLGRENSGTYKRFPVPTVASSLDLSFDWYNTDNFDSSVDKFFIGVQDIEQELVLTGASGSASNSGVSYTFQQDGSNSQIYNVGVNIPKSLYSNGELLVSFRVETSDTATKIGIDNVSIIGLCPNSEARNLEELATKKEDQLPSSKPKWGADDGSYYCLAKDFPCEDDKDKVQVCHYSSKGGYHTFCVPEADSEVLRFYSHDYCGPCVGGYGEINDVDKF